MKVHHEKDKRGLSKEGGEKRVGRDLRVGGYMEVQGLSKEQSIKNTAIINPLLCMVI